MQSSKSETGQTWIYWLSNQTELKADAGPFIFLTPTLFFVLFIETVYPRGSDQILVGISNCHSNDDDDDDDDDSGGDGESEDYKNLSSLGDRLKRRWGIWQPSSSWATL